MWENMEFFFASPKCGSHLGKKQELYLHKNYVHDANIETCRTCEKRHLVSMKLTWKYPQYCASSLTIKHWDMWFYDVFKIWYSKHILADHISTMKWNSGLFICNNCDYITKRKDTLWEHLQTKHLQTLFCCDECNFETFNSR